MAGMLMPQIGPAARSGVPKSASRSRTDSVSRFTIQFITTQRRWPSRGRSDGTILTRPALGASGRSCSRPRRRLRRKPSWRRAASLARSVCRTAGTRAVSIILRLSRCFNRLLKQVLVARCAVLKVVKVNYTPSAPCIAHVPLATPPRLTKPRGYSMGIICFKDAEEEEERRQ